MRWIIVVIISVLVAHLDARVGFKKDTSMDKIEFPPRVEKSFAKSKIPAGHLRPLGHQKRPDGRVFELASTPTPQELNTKFVEEKKPVVFRKMVQNVPATTLWTDNYLKQNYGLLKIHSVVKKELFNTGPQVMTFKKFLKEYQYEDWYLSNTVPEEMMGELVLPSVLKCGHSRSLMEAEIWMSSGGTSSLLHSHADHNLHCVLDGRKDFIVIHPDHKDKFDYIDDVAHPGHGHSEIDMDMISMFTQKSVAEAPWHWATVRPGDCIYIPAGHLHHVRSWGRSFSSTTMWAPQPHTNFDDCKGMDLDAVTPLDQAPFMWTYTHGDRELSNIKLNGKSLLHHLLIIVRTEPTLRFELFKDFYEEIFSELDDHAPVEEVWAQLAGEKLELTIKELKKVDKDTLDKVAIHLNYAHSHGPNHDEL